MKAAKVTKRTVEKAVAPPQRKQKQPLSSSYEYDKYVANSESLRDILDLYGVAIIPGVLDDSECADAYSKMWNFYEDITKSTEMPLNREDPESWKQFFALSPLHGMLVQHWGVGQAQASWDIRQNTKVAEIFAKFWKCSNEELLVSFDGMSLSLPPEITNRGWSQGKNWLHTDQSYKKLGFHCVQSWMTLLDVEEGDATLSFMEGSHLLQQEFDKNMQPNCGNEDWYKLNDAEESFYAAKGCAYKKIKCPKGSLVLWDSRTIHCGAEPVKGRAAAHTRCVVYLCYKPRSHALKPKDLTRKQEAFLNLRTTSHDPVSFRLFPKTPRTYGNPIPNLTAPTAPVLTELGRRLAGF